MVYYVYKGRDSQWRWRLVAGNGRIIADSSEGYWNKTDCLAAIELVKASRPAPVRDA
jgi:uncharacterized protein YegP (UPF0339 family)